MIITDLLSLICSKLCSTLLFFLQAQEEQSLRCNHAQSASPEQKFAPTALHKGVTFLRKKLSDKLLGHYKLVVVIISISEEVAHIIA